jgi:hypothetical protein
MDKLARKVAVALRRCRIADGGLTCGLPGLMF